MISLVQPRVRFGFALVLVCVAAARLGAQSAAARQQETAREAWQNVPAIFGAMAIEPGAVVADLGAGDGFLTARLARAVGPDGRVFAVDVWARAVERLHARVQEETLRNVTVVKGDATDPHLELASLDAAVIVNAYHEMVDYRAMLEHLRIALKPSGRLVIVEPISEKRSKAAREVQTQAHEISARFVEQEARDAGFRIQTLRAPFTSRSDVSEWMIVAVPERGIETTSAASATAPSPAADDSALASADLRIPLDQFKKRRTDNSIVVVDVRSEEEYLEGHIPGALWIQLSDLH